MAKQDILAIIGELIAAHQAHDEDRMAATLSDDFVYEEVASKRRTEGRQAFLEVWRGWRRVFPDVQGTIEEGFVSGDEAVAETVWSGTFSGDLTFGGRTYAATGRRMENVSAAIVCHAVDGRLTRMRTYFDMASLMREIGAGS